MWIPFPLRLRGAGTTQIKVSVLLPIRPSACQSLPPSRPHDPVPQSPPPHRVRSRSPHFPMRDPWGFWGGGGVGGRPGEAARARVCSRPGWACALAGGGWRRADDPAGSSFPSSCDGASPRLFLAPAGSCEAAPPPLHLLGTPLPATRSPQSPPGYPPNPRMVRSTATSVFILRAPVPHSP